jgi:hypothetical protein
VIIPSRGWKQAHSLAHCSVPASTDYQPCDGVRAEQRNFGRRCVSYWPGVLELQDENGTGAGPPRRRAIEQVCGFLVNVESDALGRPLALASRVAAEVHQLNNAGVTAKAQGSVHLLKSKAWSPRPPKLRVSTEHIASHERSCQIADAFPSN